MADNVTFQSSTLATPPDGTIVSADEHATSGKVQRMKLAMSADGSDTHVPADADGLLVNLGANNDVTVTGTVSVTEPVSVDDNGGSLTVDGTVDVASLPALPAGDNAIGRVKLTDGTDVASVTASGRLEVETDAGATVGSPPPSKAFYIAGTDGTNARGLKTDAGGELQVDVLSIAAGDNNIGNVDIVSVPSPLSTVGNGSAAAAQRVTIASDSTGVIGVTQSGTWDEVGIHDSGNSITVDGTITVPSGGVVIGVAAIRDDSGTFTRPTDAIADSGGLVTWNGNYVESPATHASTTTGNDMAADAGYRLVTTGAAGVTLQQKCTALSAAETGQLAWIILNDTNTAAATDEPMPYVGGGYYPG
jgi:hypothetical protein